MPLILNLLARKQGSIMIATSPFIITTLILIVLSELLNCMFQLKAPDVYMVSLLNCTSLTSALGLVFITFLSPCFYAMMHHTRYRMKSFMRDRQGHIVLVILVRLHTPAA